MEITCKKTDRSMPSGTVLVGDCLDRLKALPDASIDSVVTDPPYELGFMGKKWDASGIAYNVKLWEECLRVLKPGGHLLAFGATRTYHRMAVAIEDAGFEIRDSIHWSYGSGFPKSLNVGKALEAQARTGSSSPTAQRKAAMGDDYEPTPLAGTPGYGTTGNFSNKDTGGAELAVTDDTAAQWQGWGTAMKPAHEPIVVARKPLDGTVAATVLAHGTGALNIDGCRVGTEERTYPLTMTSGNFETTGGGKNKSSGSATVTGRWPANFVLTHAADCREVTQEQVSVQVPLWSCAPGCPVAELDAQSGPSRSSKGTTVSSPTALGQGNGWNKHDNRPVEFENYGDAGGASRFFPTFEWDPTADAAPFRYQAKPSKAERDAGLDAMDEQAWVQWQTGNGASGKASSMSEGRNTTRRNVHPTVKPVALMRWLVRLVTPPGGTVLDPFLGSGTTAVAAVLEGFTWVGCEMTEDYLPIIEGRVTWAEGEVAAGRKDKPRFKDPAPKPKAEPPASEEQPTLF